MAEDRFANIATFTVTESAAGTITFTELNTQLGFISGRRPIAMLVDEIDFFIAPASMALIAGDGDQIAMGVTLSNNVTDLGDLTDRRILNSMYVRREDAGTAATVMMTKMPIVHQFFPPLIHAEKLMYLGIVSSSLATPATGLARIYYRTIELSDAELVELTEVFRLVG